MEGRYTADTNISYKVTKGNYSIQISALLYYIQMSLVCYSQAAKSDQSKHQTSDSF